ncbi:hypothetical protein [Brevibacillus massiliensis]|uniref:hypothetical protein n=1 Tax=Brevibacillus massiliensis TaxID=1118054 RepID=UPI0003018B2B|nr:hypothetical protein [Brevibacillus massiliensis]
MVQQKGRDLKIAGIANASGGAYDKAEIEGIGKVHGDLECNDLKTSGKCTIKGSVKVGDARIEGMVSIAGSMSADKLTIQGHASIGGGFSGEELDVEGYLSVAENCQAETCVMDGGFTINGLLNAGTIQIKLHGSCRAKEIGGDAIRVKKGKTGFGRCLRFPSYPLPPSLPRTLSKATRSIWRRPRRESSEETMLRSALAVRSNGSNTKEYFSRIRERE